MPGERKGEDNNAPQNVEHRSASLEVRPDFAKATAVIRPIFPGSSRFLNRCS